MVGPLHRRQIGGQLAIAEAIEPILHLLLPLRERARDHVPRRNRPGPDHQHLAALGIGQLDDELGAEEVGQRRAQLVVGERFGAEERALEAPAAIGVDGGAGFLEGLVVRAHRLDQHLLVERAVQPHELGAHAQDRRRHLVEELALRDPRRLIRPLERAEADARQDVAEPLLALHDEAQPDLRGGVGVAVRSVALDQVLELDDDRFAVEISVEPVADDDAGVAIDERLIGRLVEVDAQRAVGGGDARLGRLDARFDGGDALLQRGRLVLQQDEAHLRQRLEIPVDGVARRRRHGRVERVRRQAELLEERLPLFVAQGRQTAAGAGRRLARQRRRVGIARRQLLQQRLQLAAQRRRLLDRLLGRLELGLHLAHLGELRLELAELFGAAPGDRLIARRHRARNAGVDGVELLLRRLEPRAQPVGGAVDLVHPLRLGAVELRTPA